MLSSFKFSIATISLQIRDYLSFAFSPSSTSLRMAFVGSRLSFRSINSRLSKLFWTFEQMAFPAGLFFGRCPRIGETVDLYGSKVSRGRRITALLSAGDFHAA